MCGIAGFNGNFDKLLLRRMADSIRTRGPDNVGLLYLNKAHVGLAHTRLSIIDLSESANQPMLSNCGKVTIVFNGEIYNYRELRDGLKDEGYVFKTLGDTEVLLNMYLKYGIDLLAKLNGMFAIAIYDSRIQKTFIARDGQGVKPLYYTSTAKGFLFASELKALLQEPSVDREINPEAVAAYLTYLWAPCPMTMLSGVHKLEQGHCLCVVEGKIVDKWEFYDYPYDLDISQLSAVEAVRETALKVENAVRSQLVADVPVGAFLSGGLDSSAVVAMAKKIEPDSEFPCYTINFKDDRLKKEGIVEDLPYAELVADHLGVKLHKLTVGADMIMDLEKILYHLDEPQADPAPLNAMYICELAKSQGIKVLLSGVGGDDIFTGYRRHYALQNEHYWNWLPIPARKLLKVSSSLFGSRNPSLRRVAKAFQYADLPQQERLVSYFYWIDPAVSKNLISDEYRSRLPIYTPQRQLISSLNKLPDNVSNLQKMLYLEQKHFLTDHNLNYTDKVSMAHGVEVRVPLLDPNLIAHALTLPDYFKQRGVTGKWIFKKSMEPYLPREVIYRPKTGFGAPLRFWIKNDLKHVVNEMLSDVSIKNRGLFNPVTVKKMIEDDRRGKSDYAYPIFALLCIEVWCRIFLDSSVPSLKSIN